jgi:benzoylformate decarboxylase
MKRCTAGRLFGMQTLVGTQFPELDFCALAQGHGVAARAAQDLPTLDAALAWSLAAAGTLVEAEVA